MYFRDEFDSNIPKYKDLFNLDAVRVHLKLLFDQLIGLGNYINSFIAPF